MTDGIKTLIDLTKITSLQDFMGINNETMNSKLKGKDKKTNGHSC